jgi:hypothetical protein
MADYIGLNASPSAVVGIGDAKSSSGITGPAMPPVATRQGLVVVPPQRGLDVRPARVPRVPRVARAELADAVT